jgi:hypothetical protein
MKNKTEVQKDMLTMIEDSQYSIEGYIKDYKQGKSQNNNKRIARAARNLSSLFRDNSSATYHRIPIKFEGVQYKDKECLKEHCLGLQSVANYFLDNFSYCEFNFQDVVDYLNVTVFQISVPRKKIDIILDGEKKSVTINWYLSKAQNKMFITCDEYLDILKMFGLVMEKESEKLFRDRFKQVDEMMQKIKLKNFETILN